jgi:hypothetical protein
MRGILYKEEKMTKKEIIQEKQKFKRVKACKWGYHEDRFILKEIWGRGGIGFEER